MGRSAVDFWRAARCPAWVRRDVEMVELARKRCEGPLVEIRSGNLIEPPSLQEKRERLALTLAAQSAVAVTSRAGLPAPRPCKRSVVKGRRADRGGGRVR